MTGAFGHLNFMITAILAAAIDGRDVSQWLA